MQKISQFVLFLLLSNSLWSQMDIKQGDWDTPATKGTHQGFVMSDSNFVYSIDYQNNTFRNEQRLTASLYDKKTLKFHSSFDIIPEKKEGYDLNLTQIFSVNQSIVLVIVENKKDRSNEKRIILQRILPNGTKEKEIIADTLPSQQNVNEDFQVIVDQNETGFVICTNYPVSLEENQKLKITAFNSDLTQKWRKTVEFPNKEKQYIFTDWRYDGGTKVFFLSRHIIDMYQIDMEFSPLNQNTYFLWGYDFSKDKLKEIELSLNQRFIHKITIEKDKDRWLVAGIFANDKNFQSDGVFNLILDSSWSVISHRLHNFNYEENLAFSKQSNARKADKKNKTIQIKSIERFENGEFALIGEEYFKEIEEPNDGRMTTTNFTEIFHYVNISVYWFDSIGMIKGVYIIPKNQISINDQGVYSSYTLAKNKKDLFFFYNDNPKNLSGQNPTADNPKPISGFRKIYLKSVQINNKGVTKNKIVFSSSRKAHIRPKKGSQMPDGITYFLVQKNRKNALLTIEFH
jgi:hypothetical protein|tara:strand:- start:2494 stop:4038 length:1545 start_codon:yes stop_codon:yes gene_type:complete